MKTPANGTTLLGAFLVCLATISCSKDIALKQKSIAAATELQTSSPTTSAISNVIDLAGFLGTYTVRDEKTVYQGQANAQGSNVFIHLSYLDVQKRVSATDDKKHLTMPVGTDTANHWAYIIGYDKATKTILLSPNPDMQEDIVAGSFETLYAAYDPKTKEGAFTIRFTALKDNGNESQLSESFWKE